MLVSGVLLLLALMVVFVLPSLIPPPSGQSTAKPMPQPIPPAVEQPQSPPVSRLPLETSEGLAGDTPTASPEETMKAQPAPDEGTDEAAPGGSGKQQRKELFHAAMSDFLRAMEQQEWKAADAALKLARGIEPESEAVRDGRLQLVAAIRARVLYRLESHARKTENEEQWQQARQRYAEILQLDPTSTLALHGKQQAEERLKLIKSIDRYLHTPGLLQADESLANAKKLLAYLEQLPEKGVKLRASQGRLARLVATAERLLPVHIRSDEATEVVIYQVGRLGRFSARTLELRPGTYTVVGSREGFRDVRKVFTLQPGAEVEILVRCEERI